MVVKLTCLLQLWREGGEERGKKKGGKEGGREGTREKPGNQLVVK